MLGLLLGGLVAALACVAFWRGAPAAERRWAALGGPALVLGLCLPSLGWGSLEHLEASYLFEAVKPATAWEVISGRQASEQMHQPLFTLILRDWVRLAGTSEAAVRLPSALFAALATLVVWRLGRSWRSATEAALGAGLFALSPLLVWYAKDCSPYALLALTGALSLRFATDLVSGKPERWSLLGTAVSLALGFYTHFHGAWVAVFVGGWLLAEGRYRPFFALTAGVFVLCAPALGLLLDKLVTSVQGLVEDQPMMRHSHALTEAIPEALRVYFGGERWAWAGVLIATVAATLRSPAPLRRLALVAAAVAVLAEAHILWQLSRSKGIVYVDVRHYLAWLPLTAVLLAGARPWLVGLCAALMLTTSAPMITGALQKPDAREAFEWLKARATGPEHGVSILPAPWYSAIGEYYLLGICDELVHGRSFEGWWEPGTCALHEQPKAGTMYGFPFGADRFWLSRLRRGLTTLWLVDLRDHRFGLPVPPSTAQEAFLRWTSLTPEVEVRFGPWVTIRGYAVSALEAPPAE